ncbi:LPS translocon maturation chaperone LptM [Pseudomarimonas arenosa]|nr:lipoprotein [Pseudomarimonas arenosa]
MSRVRLACYVALLLCLAGSLTACGNKGELVRPAKSHSQQG